MKLSTGRHTQTLAPPLPMPYPALAASGLLLRRGWLSLWAAAPSVGKSVLLRNIALRAKAPTLYLSADTDLFLVQAGTLAALTDEPLAQVVANLGQQEWRDFYDQTWLPQAAHIDWSFDTDVRLERVALRLAAYAEIHGRYPELVVLDNLGDAVDGADSDRKFAELERVMHGLRSLARATDCHIAALHHATGEYEDGNKMIPLSGTLGKVGKVPDQVVTLWLQDEHTLGIHLAKNRNGAKGVTTSLPIDYTRAVVDGYRLDAA